MASRHVNDVIFGGEYKKTYTDHVAFINVWNSAHNVWLVVTE